MHTRTMRIVNYNKKPYKKKTKQSNGFRHVHISPAEVLHTRTYLTNANRANNTAGQQQPKSKTVHNDKRFVCARYEGQGSGTG